MTARQPVGAVSGVDKVAQPALKGNDAACRNVIGGQLVDVIPSQPRWIY